MDKNTAEYRKQYQREWHQKNRERRLAANKARRDEYNEWFREYKKTLSCVRCGFSHPAALDFHHRDGDTKDDDINRMVANKANKKRLLEEIEKCDVLCANCHRIEHYNQTHGLVAQLV